MGPWSIPITYRYDAIEMSYLLQLDIFQKQMGCNISTHASMLGIEWQPW